MKKAKLRKTDQPEMDTKKASVSSETPALAEAPSEMNPPSSIFLTAIAILRSEVVQIKEDIYNTLKICIQSVY